MTIPLFTIGFFWVMLGATLTTNGDFASKLVFKVFPIATGGFVMYYAASSLNWI